MYRQLLNEICLLTVFSASQQGTRYQNYKEEIQTNQLP